jgi:hypothetical protein
MHILSYKGKVSTQSEWILYTLVFSLVFEGLARKVLPALNTPIFFLKDILCIVGIFLINRASLPSINAKLKTIWLRLVLLFIPLLYFTGFKDPILAVFASKQYLLYIVIGTITAVAFPIHKEENFRKFIYFTSLLLIPTTIIAILQNALPPNHWLNVSVTGDSLEAFSASGYLRVGSTFSFTGQYSWFLNAESFFLATSFFMPPSFKLSQGKWGAPFIYSVLALMLLIGVFITGGRTAVLGCGGTLALAGIFIGIKRPGWLLSKGVLIIALFIISLSVLKAVKPQYFMAYTLRSAGTEHTTHNEEIAERIIEGFANWTDWFWDQDAVAVMVGNGLGIMSNGSSQVSSYASAVRATGLWMEGDIPTTLWEGGLYLAIVWYGFRIFIVFLCYRLWHSLKNIVLASAAAAPLGYIIIHGLTATFGMQPPLSIWWWLAIGILAFIYQLESYRATVSKLAKCQKYEEESHIR